MNNFLAISLLLLASNMSAEDKRVKNGFPYGYLSDCPGSTKEARITNKSLKYLQIVVLGRGNALTAKKTLYTYHQMKELAATTDFNKKTFFYMPGYIDSINLPSSALLGLEYKKRGYNVWILEYFYFNIQYFPVAVRVLRAVGQKIAEMLAELTKFGLNPKKLHIAGISLGGHGVSMIAKHYRHLTGLNISHITGLDPSGPCFRNLGPDQRLDASDADFVEVLHANMDGFGMPTTMGHVDFYINGGEYQPADLPFAACESICSHLKVFLYWLAALKNPKCFIGMQCDSIQEARDWNCYDRKPLVTNYMGECVNKTRQGIFFLPTNYGYPYCMGEKGLKKENNFIAKVTGINDEEVVVV